MSAPRVLRDGTPVVLRRLQPEDREALRQAYLELSPESRYSRFLAAVPQLTPAMLDRLVDRVDDVDHVARLLVSADDPDDEIAVGRFVRDEQDPSRADVAFTVAESRHGTGAGSALCDGLVCAALERGVTHFTATLLASNTAAAHLMARAGEIVTRHVGHPGTAELLVALREPPLPPPPLVEAH